MTAVVQPGRPVIELDYGITVYPARFDGDRWRAAGRAALPRAGCGDSVGILGTVGGACVMRLSRFLRCRR